MESSISSILALVLCVLPGDLDHNGIVNFDDLAIFADNWLKSAYDANDLPDPNHVGAVTIALTKLQVSDETFELGWTITNSSDHNVWLCDILDVQYESRFEVYVADDGQTLVIRRRLDVPLQIVYSFLPISQYVRLGPGVERAESLSLTVPVRRRYVFTAEGASAEYATRLVLEVGFFNEDLPGLILGILEAAEKLDCANFDLDEYDPSIVERYFRAVSVVRYFGGSSSFNKYQPDVSEQIKMNIFCPVLRDEQVLRVRVDDVFIPYQRQAWKLGKK